MKKLGFGFMRLPLCDADDYRSVDGEQVKKMVDQFMSHGFTAIADVQIQDENGSMALPVAGGTNLTENYVGAAFSDYDSYLVLSHFKGHAMAGFGGAIKNISIGLASGEGKCWIHTGGESLTSFMGGTREAFTESMAEAGKSVSDYLGNGERITYINVMNRLSIDCDCNATPAEPDLHDIGILASNDPVALDQACIDFDYSGYGQKEFLPMKKFLLFLLACALLLSATACASAQAAASSEDIAGLSDRSSSGGASEEPSAAQAESALSGAEEPLPDHGWQFDDPENHQMDPEVLKALHRALPGSGIHAVVTVKDGVIIDEYYEDGYAPDHLFGIHSASKSFTGALIGIAISEGAIGGVDDLVSDYLPQLLEQEDTRKRSLTLRHLLTQTSGLEWYEWGSGYSNWAEFRSAENWVDYILGRRLIHEPGTVFNYSTGNTHLLSAVLQAATGMTQEEYCRIHLFDPMGVSGDAHWRTDPQGIADGGNGAYLSPRDAAKFGQLFLDGGVWRGQQLVPASWVEESTSIQNPGPGGSTGAYGYQWWVRTHTTGEYGAYVTPYPTASYDTYFAFGYAGQFIYVVPELELVTVITGSCPSSYTPRPYFTDYILNAYQGG